MALILNIETSTTNCSICLSEDGKPIGLKEINDGYKHAEFLHLFIESILNDHQKKVEDLEAIAVGSGPGSYTGLRIGVSAAKGLAYGLNIPLISLNSLQVLASGAKENIQDPDAILQPMLDARRMEVYTAVFDMELATIQKTHALIIENNNTISYPNNSSVYFFGDGMHKCKTLLNQNNFNFIENLYPSAKNMCFLSELKFNQKEFENTFQFEPFYLKDFLVGNA